MVLYNKQIFNSYIIYIDIISGFSQFSLIVLSVIAVFASILVILSKNPIISVLFLIGLFLSISIYLLLLGVNFIGLSYLLVYIGAISILFLFILMLINVRISELLIDNYNSIPLVVIINLSFLFFLSYVVLSLKHINTNHILVSSKHNENLFDTESYYSMDLSNGSLTSSLLEQVSDIINGRLKHVSSIMWDGNLAEHSHIASIGNIMYSSFSMWLILTCIILLLAMVGCIVITIKQKN